MKRKIKKYVKYIIINLILWFIFTNLFLYKVKAQNENIIPNINARHAVVLERDTGMILFGKKENERCKMASTTKIMTAIIVLENVNNLDEKVVVSEKSARTGGSRLGLSTNDEISVNDLLYGLMMVSRK